MRKALNKKQNKFINLEYNSLSPESLCFSENSISQKDESIQEIIISKEDEDTSFIVINMITLECN